MEHATVTKMSDGYYKIVPDKGYKLYNESAGSYYSVALTRNVNEYIAVKK
jgi:hypothetical protein